MAGPREASVSVPRIHRRELGIAVGREVRRVKRVVIEREREGQCDGGDTIITMVADVRRAGHDTASYLV